MMAKKQTQEEPIDRPADWKDTSLRLTPIDKLINERDDLVQSYKQAKEQIEVIDVKIRGLLEKHKLLKVRVGRFQPTIFESHKPRRVDPAKLVELGVKQSLIDKATTGGEAYQTFRIFEEREG